MRHQYEKTALTRMERFCKERHLPLELIPVDGKTIADAGRNFESGAEKLARSLPDGTLLVTHNIHSDRFDSGELLDPEQYPGLDFMTQSLPHDRCRIKYMKRDFSDMQQAIVKFIETPDTERHQIIDYKDQIIDPANRAGGKK